MTNKSRVLIVDDDPRNVRILCEILGEDFDLYSASDGESALDVVKEHSLDIILLDIMMPGMDGYEVCKKIKESKDNRNIKIILVSGKSLTEDRIKGYESGADDFVSKPFDMDEILAKVNVFAKLKSMEEVTKLKTDFLSLINHETGTPLNHIIGISDLLIKEGGMSESMNSSIKDISSSAHFLSEKISKILFLSKLKQTSVDNTIDMDVKDILDEVMSSLGETPTDMDIKLEIDDGLMIKGDYDLIQKLFIYLMMSAINISSSSVRCRAMAATNSKHKQGIEIQIIDSGPRLSDTQARYFFDPFYIDDLMLHSEGLNITMAICGQIVDMHHGKIDVNNNDDGGTTISMWLPDYGQR